MELYLLWTKHSTAPVKRCKMWDVRACRSCLATDGRLEKLGLAQKRMYISMSGLKFSEGDGYPAYFCVECRNQIKRTLAFRRKTRRAEFVLQEIMTVKKQVTVSDISKVNRIRTNLKSTITYWDPFKSNSFTYNHNNKSYTKHEDLIYEETNTSTLDTEDGNLQMYEPQVINKTCQIIDLPPDVETKNSLTQEHEFTEYNDQTEVTEPIESNDIDHAEIDLDDVFKDLNEPESESEEDIAEPEPEPLPIKPETSEKKTVKIHSYLEEVFVDSILSFMPHSHHLNCSRTLEHCDIKELDLEQQLHGFEVRKSIEPFKSSVFKCSICIHHFNSFELLIKHVTAHNETQGPHVCLVCKRSYRYAESLHRHEKEQHAFQYTCKLCGHQAYSLPDIYNHGHSRHKDYQIGNAVMRGKNKDHQYAAADKKSEHMTFLKLIYNVTELSQGEMSLTVSELSDEGRSSAKSCVHCNRIFRSSKCLLQHLKIHSQPSRDKINLYGRCDICRIWRYKRNMASHFQYYHKFKYSCRRCDKVCWNMPQALEHGKKHEKTLQIKTMNQYCYYKRRLGNLPIVDSGNTVDDSEKPFKFLRMKKISIMLHAGRPYYLYNTGKLKSNYFRCSTRKCYGTIGTKDDKICYTTKHEDSCKPDENRCALYEQLYMKEQKQINNIDGNNVGVDDGANGDGIHVFCNVCGVSPKRCRNLYAHQLKSHGYISLMSSTLTDESMYCKHCSMQFLNKVAYQTHCVRKNHDEANDVPYKCRYARRAFKDVDEYNRHSETCPNCKKYICRYCEESFQCLKDYKVHYMKNHKDLPYYDTQQKSALCEQCGKSVHLTQMNMHLRNHTLKGDGKVIEKEQTSVGMRERLFGCPLCPTSFNNATHLSVHILFTHTRKPYICAVCQCAFKHRVDCKDHILKIHAPEKPYTCEICPQRFSHRDHLKAHARKDHSGLEIKIEKTRPKARKVYVYPHLLIDATLIPQEFLEATEIELVDYLDNEVEKVEDYRNYMITDPLPAPNRDRIRRKRSVPASETGGGREKRTKEIGELEKMGREIELQLENEIELEEESNAVSKDDASEAQGSDGYEDDEESQTFEIEYKDGERYVTINDVLYKIEESND